MTATVDKTQELEQELETLEQQLRDAEQAAATASRRLQAIDRERDELSAGVFGGDPDAIERYKMLEEEEQAAHRAHRIAGTAAEQLTSTIVAAKEELREEKRRVARERYEELLADQPEVLKGIEDAAAALGEALKEHSRWYGELVAEGQRFQTDREHEALHLYAPGTQEIRHALRRHLGSWR